MFTIIQCLNVQQAEKSTQNLNLYSMGTVISAVGKLCHFSGRLSLNSFQTRLVENDAEIEHFRLESRLAHLYYEKNLPEFSAAEMEEVSVPLFSTLPPSHSDAKCEISQVQTECDGYDISAEPISCPAVEVMETSDQREETDYIEEDEFGSDDSIICELEDGQPMQYYISKLQSDSVDIMRSALIRILSLLHTDHLDNQSEITELIRALFQCLQMSSDLNVSDLIGKCLGAVGAIDNEKKPFTHTITIENMEKKPLIFVTDKLGFYQEFFKACVNLYTRCINSGKDETARQLASCVRSNFIEVRKLHGIGDKLCSNLSSDVELQVLLNFNDASEIASSSDRSLPCPVVFNDRPLLDSACTFSEWLRNWYCFTVAQMANDTMKNVFLSLLIVNDDSVMNLMCQLLPSAILQVIIDDHKDFMAKLLQEITAIFSSYLDNPLDWIRNVVLTIFSILDYLENERCNCYFRALKWLEQYGIARDVLGMSVFKRELFYRLEHLFISLEDIDGVDGARVVAMQAVGKYNEALFLCQSAKNQEKALVNCFLRLNQPEMARNTVECYLARSAVDVRTRQILYDQQIEALGKMSDWGN
uniref:non-specific serine/threonine protein kinase n=1 Tax=Ditylenchus dipsaci TaxID=166011 RepID=A0A915D1C4_9BILA